MAAELFEARHYPSAVAICSDALNDEPDCQPLRMIRARAQMALRKDLDAQTDLRDVIRLDPECALAYRLLGELAIRRNHNSAAVAFFREALRLDPEDREAHDWLMIVEALVPPRDPIDPVGMPSARGSGWSAGEVSPRFARGTEATPDDDRPTQPFASAADPDEPRRATATRTPPAPIVVATPTLYGHPPTQPPAKPAPRLVAPWPAPRATIPELPGFGEYLVTAGILSRERLRAAQAYQRSMKVQLATAIVTLGLATPQRIEGAAVAHQSQLAQPPDVQ